MPDTAIMSPLLLLLGVAAGQESLHTFRCGEAGHCVRGLREEGEPGVGQAECHLTCRFGVFTAGPGF